jgi:hypothetical protein
MERMSGWVTGFVFFAAVMMMVIGVFQIIAGLTAIFKDDIFVFAGDYIFKFNVTAWGWIHLIGGIIVLLAGFYLLSGRLWAIIVGIVVASLSAIENFMSIPYYPVWSILIIAIDIVVIWALAVYGREGASSV